MKTLISISSCNRISDVKKYIWDYLKFVNSNENFHFVLALDGYDKDYIDFCEKYDIPLIYSENREGVGLSKNRVFSHFPSYEYYFFIEDDIELKNSEIFKSCINLSNRMNFHHLCGNIDHVLVNKTILKEIEINYSMRGGGYFLFYTKEGLNKVGGWHTLFAKYKRYGHTEHSYRFYHAGLQEAPFIFAEKFSEMLLIHSPVSVTKNTLETNENELIEEEQHLIDSKTTYFPLQTLSPFYFNNKKLGFNKYVEDFLSKNPQRYPLSFGKERKLALAEYYALLINRKRNSHFYNFVLAIKSFINSPMNNELKHAIKFYFK